jgi:elongin-A
VRDPEQLAKLEQNSPQLKGETGELWMNLIKRDVSSWKKFMFTQPRSNGKVWTEEQVKPKLSYKQYERLVGMQEEEDQKALDILRASTLKNEEGQQAKKLVMLDIEPQIGSRKRGSASERSRSTQVSAASKALAKIRRINAERKSLYGGPKFLSSPIRAPSIPQARTLGMRAVSKVTPLKRKIVSVVEPAAAPVNTKRRKQAVSEKRVFSDDSDDSKPRVSKGKQALAEPLPDRLPPSAGNAAKAKLPLTKSERIVSDGSKNRLTEREDQEKPSNKTVGSKSSPVKTAPASTDGASDRQRTQQDSMAPKRRRPAPAIMLPNRRPK